LRGREREKSDDSQSEREKEKVEERHAAEKDECMRGWEYPELETLVGHARERVGLGQEGTRRERRGEGQSEDVCPRSLTDTPTHGCMRACITGKKALF